MEVDIKELYSKFLDLKQHYSSRNALLDDQKAFFDGDQWETASPEFPEATAAEVREEAEAEEVRLVLNYTRRATLWHVAYLTRKFPRVDVPQNPVSPDPSAISREKFLRAIFSTSSFGRAYRRLELHAAKYGFGVFQILWKPGPGQPVTKKVGRAPGSTAPPERRVYTKSPFVFRAINPRRFYPRYRTYDYPDDFLYVFRYDPGRLVKDIEDQYGVVLEGTANVPGIEETCDLVEYWDNESYVLMAIASRIVTNEDGDSEEIETPNIIRNTKNPYGRPPFFVLPNVVLEPDEDPTYGGSLSEVDLVEEANKHLNLVLSMTEQEIANRIHPSAVYKTDDPQQDPHRIRLGAGEVIPIGTEEDIAPLSWPGVPQVVLQHGDRMMQVLKDMSGLPRTSFGSDQGAASGVGMRLSYAALELVLALKLPERAQFLMDVGAFLLEATEKMLTDTSAISLWDANKQARVVLSNRDVDGDYFCIVKYGNIIPRDKIEWEQHVVYLYKTGTLSLLSALERLEDIDDPMAELERIKEERKDEVLHPEVAQALAALRQQPQPRGGEAGGPSGSEELTMNAAPPVPTTPAMPTQRNAPFLQRGQVPNIRQVGGMQPGIGPGINLGPPMEQQR